MDPTALKRHLDTVVTDLDAGRTPSRPGFARPALATFLLVGLVAGCEEPVEAYGVPAETGADEICDNDTDDDGDGDVDCDDADCDDDAACADVALYGAP